MLFSDQSTTIDIVQGALCGVYRGLLFFTVNVVRRLEKEEIGETIYLTNERIDIQDRSIHLHLTEVFALPAGRLFVQETRIDELLSLSVRTGGRIFHLDHDLR